jgi:hypothetical protein
MSSVTVAQYRVETEAEQQLRLRQAARARFATAAAELAAVAAEADGYRAVYGERIGRVPGSPWLAESAGATEIDAATDELQSRTQRHRARLAEQLSAAVGEQMTGFLAVAPPRSAAPAGPVRAADSAKATAMAVEAARRRAGERRANLAERAGAQLKRLPGTADPELRRWCEQAAAEVVHASSEQRARLVLDDLEARVRQSVEETTAIAGTAAALAELAIKLEPVPGPAALELRRRIEGHIADRARSLPPELPAQVARLIAEADRARHRRIAANAVRASLLELGYDVGEGFDTALLDRGAAYASHPDSSDHGIKLLLDDGDAVVRTQVVRRRGAAGGPDADVEAERHFCARYPALVGRMAHHGVEMGPPRTVEPGAVRLPQVDEDAIPDVQPLSRPRVREREQ